MKPLPICWILCFLVLTPVSTPEITFAQVQEERETTTADQESVIEQVQQAMESAGRRRAPAGLKSYLGRKIAQTMHYEGAPWLIRSEREREERCSMMLANLGLRRSMVVCDMGCGNGFHSLPIARLIGDQGQVLAVDIQPQMLMLLRERMEAEGVDNITPILGSEWDPRLPPESVDLVLMVDVYHEFSHPVQMMEAIRRSLKPDGAIVLVEFRAEDENVPIKPLHKMSKEQVEKEMRENGFRLRSSFDRLPWQHLLTYEADPEWSGR